MHLISQLYRVATAELHDQIKDDIDSVLSIPKNNPGCAYPNSFLTGISLWVSGRGKKDWRQHVCEDGTGELASSTRRGTNVASVNSLFALRLVQCVGGYCGQSSPFMRSESVRHYSAGQSSMTNK